MNEQRVIEKLALRIAELEMNLAMAQVQIEQMQQEAEKEVQSDNRINSPD